MSLLDLTVGKGTTRGAMSIFPVWSAQASYARSYVLGAGRVQVAEREGSPVVGQLVVTNPGPTPALVLEGDCLLGGRQDRVANESILVAAGQGHVLSVSCSERSRWSGGDQHRAVRRRAPMEVRAALRQDQNEVWRRVDVYGNRHGHDSTRSLRHATAQVQAQAAALVEGVRPLAGQSGMLICLSGQPYLLEVLSSPREFLSLMRPLLRSAAVDALSAPSDEPTPGRRARRFIDRLCSTDLTRTGDAGIGTSLRGQSSYVDLRGLLWQDKVLSATALNPRHQLVNA